ncbi:MAG TPA: carboxylating nicotinate-nucleotide diphosphorylase [Gemmataceae bacterium]|jgi:nicotinate-nucleotide pyrophosphorylase (carboxylating)|nr:carboxylating nicotinate-nucleotide diphosphorylase [Gemmataceae bacterium]
MTPADIGYLTLLIDFALTEDLSDDGDVTSRATIAEDVKGKAAFAARTPGVLAGIEAAERVCLRVDHHLQFTAMREDGYRLGANETFATVEGPMRSILIAERTALNFLQRLSGIASLTRQFVDAVAGLPVKILDTRKTTPGWRLLEKYAVRMGGGTNHRIGLFDMVLIKDNHLAAIRPKETAIRQAVEAARSEFPTLPVEVEVETLEQLDQALVVNPDYVLLDNMPLERMREAVRRRNAVAPAVKLEASGGVNLQTVRAIAETGVDRISVGALTHSAKALDIALDYIS